MKRKVLKSLMLTLVSTSMVASGTGVTTFAAEIEEFSDSIDLTAEEADVGEEISDSAEEADVTQEAEPAEEPEIEVQDPEEESDTAEAGDGFDLDVFSDGETATEEELPESGEANSFTIEGTVLKKYTGTGGNVTIPEGITEIESYAFEYCTGVQTVVIPSSVTKIGYRAFWQCKGLRTVTLNQGLKTIGESAFYGCTAIKNMTIPKSVTSIDGYAFYGCSALGNVTLQNGLLEIGHYAFSDCGLTTLTIPGTVTSVGAGAFQRCKSLVSASVPGSVGQVGESYFSECTNLTSVTLGSGITEIGYETFKNCVSLGTVTIPASVTKIGSYAFYGCQNLKTNIPAKIETIGTSAFKGCAALTTVSLPNTLTDIGHNAFAGTGTTSVTIPASVTGIGSSIFEGCTDLTSATVYGSTVPDSCFEGCSSLKTVTVASGVISIQYEAFYKCTSLTNISIANTVTSIGSYAFQNCTALSEIYLPDSVTTISGNAMQGCKSLTKAVIPESVTVFGRSIFWDCPNVTIYGVAGSFAEDYANEYDIPFVDSTPVQPITATFYKNKGNTVSSGDAVRLWVQASGGSGALQYKFLICDEKGNWYLLRNYSSDAAITWTPGATGNKTLYCDIKDEKGTTVRKSMNIKITEALGGRMALSTGTSVYAGDSVTIWGAGTGGTGSYQYKFLLLDEASGKWFKIKDYGTQRNVTWTPGASGKKTLYVDIKDGSGKVCRKATGVTVYSKVNATFVSSAGSSCTKGSKVALTAQGSGGAGGYQYKFLICDAKGNWYKIQDFSSNRSITWTATTTGTKTLYVDVKDRLGRVVRKSKTITVTANTPLKVSYLKTDSYPGYVGSTLTLSAGASGGSGTYYYKFLVQDLRTGSWYKIQDFSTKSTAKWKPGSAGEKKLYVDVKDGKGTTVRSEIRFYCY
ncbi:leucine-rich repeat protein [Blautia sp. MSJ-19]|uniref:leucine-rich repeat protein n=1 Tax=Blautia sp. MSJ-19 TaxID=2841517 RepID=UPI001C0ED38D|nr:leucine-rich repeat protein [Blautia sp. MSJ-19]MBU5480124.1 leucine-rich repeat protein [Blautia sp. MSJ-19]